MKCLDFQGIVKELVIKIHIKEYTYNNKNFVANTMNLTENAMKNAQVELEVVAQMMGILIIENA